jgi:hypothetical protein
MTRRVKLATNRPTIEYLMKILLYNDVVANNIPNFAKFCQAIEADNFTQADVRKIDSNLYRARLNRSDRLLFSLYRYQNDCYCLVLEYLPNHRYDISRFLQRGVTVDENKIPAIDAPPDKDTLTPLSYINPKHDRFHLLDKILSFDDDQNNLYNVAPPIVIIGSAGSGKTALTLEKMKHATGDVLYVSLSSFLVQNSRNLYYAHGYNNDDQTVDFLSFREWLESIRVPDGREITWHDFNRWFAAHKAGTGIKDSHGLFEEFRGVLTGSVTEQAWLTRDAYLNLGIKQSIFTVEQRDKVYTLFEKYQRYLQQQQLFDPNIISHDYLARVTPCYDFIVIDEVQDFTAIQLYLMLKSLRQAGQFMLCGDANQIVHPNFFSWSKIKTLFFENSALTQHHEIIRILHTNYRNSTTITHIANRLLKLKHARFGSIDRESNYLVRSIGEQPGHLQLLDNTQAIKTDLDNKTYRSTQFAALVMHPDQKEAAKRWFRTPLIFSIQEAKGLEYENIILFNFISDESRAFRDIAQGVDPKALDKDTLHYSRSKDKHDKSLEIYKFFINALYVGITRAVRNLYWIESEQKHPIVNLLQLAHFSDTMELAQQDSSLDAWQQEAHRLELQGKQEQAAAIREQILQEKPVPWTVIDREQFHVMQSQAFEQGHKKTCLAVLEYALLYHDNGTIQRLRQQGFKTAQQAPDKARQVLYRNHYFNYDIKHPTAVLRDTEKYGIDHRTRFNLTPLMVATRLGNTSLVEQLIKRGADIQLRGSDGLNAFQTMLTLALNYPKYARDKVATIYALLEPDSVSIQVNQRLVKLDKRLMGCFILHVMLALFYTQLGRAIMCGRAFTAPMLTELLQHLPDSVLPDKRKRPTYISSILSGNEVARDDRYNRRLFLRIKRGHYIINPGLKLRAGNDGAWEAVYDMLNVDAWGHTLYHEADGMNQRFIADNMAQFIRHITQDNTQQR